MTIKDEVLKEFEPMKIYETQEELGDELEFFVGWDEEDVEKMIERTLQRVEKLIKNWKKEIKAVCPDCKGDIMDNNRNLDWCPICGGVKSIYIEIIRKEELLKEISQKEKGDEK